MRAVARTALIAVAAFATAALCAEPVVLQAHRMLQFDSTVFGEAASAALKRGSAKSAMRGTLTTNPERSGPTAPVLIDASDLTAMNAEAVVERAAGGVIVVLPEGGMDAATAAEFTRLEAVAVKTQAAGAIYAVPHSANVTALRELMAQSDSVQVLAAADAPAARTAATSTAVVVLSAEAVKPPPKGRAVAVVAGFDTLGAFPSLPQPGAAADAAVLVEAAAAFGGLKAAADRGLTFIAASGSRHSYTGLKQWAVTAEGNALVDRADVVLCLEGVAAAEELTLHTARAPAKDQQLEGLVGAFGGASAMKVATKRVDPSSNELRWAHEVFAHKGASAATLAGVQPGRQALRSSHVNAAASPQAIAAAADKVIGALSRLTGIQPKDAVSVERIEKTLRALGDATEPRPSYAMPPKAVGALHQQLNAAIQAGGPKGKGAPRVRKSEFGFAPPEATFYSPDTAVLRAYASKPVAFELTLTAVIVGSLAAAAVALFGPSGAMKLLSKK
uniref:Uncharacterized protein n=1 Tax=Neobodo designis TaxID=312471 RepID=A0A7S1LEH1_NEODS